MEAGNHETHKSKEIQDVQVKGINTNKKCGKNNNNHAVLQQYQATVSMKAKNSQQHAQNLPLNYIFQLFV